MKRTILVSLMVTLVTTLAQAQPATIVQQSYPRTIATSGESTVFVAPDEVVVNLGVETFNVNLEEATAANEKESARLINAIREMGIEAKHLQTSELSISIRYRSAEPINRIEGYIAQRAYAITLKDVKRFEELAKVALRNGANQLMGFQFRNTELRKHRDEARKMAIRAAREKAILLASELGCKIGMPRTINESSPVIWSGRSYGNSYMTQNSMQMAGGGGESGGETLPLGQIGIQATVHVTFDLLPE